VKFIDQGYERLLAFRRPLQLQHHMCHREVVRLPSGIILSASFGTSIAPQNDDVRIVDRRRNHSSRRRARGNLRPARAGRQQHGGQRQQKRDYPSQCSSLYNFCLYRLLKWRTYSAELWRNDEGLTACPVLIGDTKNKVAEPSAAPVAPLFFHKVSKPATRMLAVAIPEGHRPHGEYNMRQWENQESLILPVNERRDATNCAPQQRRRLKVNPI
jgi:hypothetical protein